MTNNKSPWGRFLTCLGAKAGCKPAPRAIAFIILLSLISSAFTDEPEALDFVVHTAAGTDFTGPLRKLAADGSVRLGGDRPALVAGQDVVTVRRQGHALPGFPRSHAVILTHGDRVPLSPEFPVRLEQGRLHWQLPAPLRTPLGPELKVPRAFVAALWLTAPEGEPDLVPERLLGEKRSRDLVILRNGDRVEGTLTAIDPKRGCLIDAGSRKVEVGLGQVAAVIFNTDLQARIRPQKQYTHLVLQGGGRLGFASLQLEAGSQVLQGKTLFGVKLEVPVTQLASLEPRLGRVDYLSDLEPKAYEHTPFMGISWPLVRDASATGRPLCLAGSTYDKGLGTHSQCRVSYALNGAYQWFETLVGLDEHTGRRGRVRLQVLVDGKEQELQAHKELTGKEAPLALRIDVRKARELTLVVGFGSFGDVQAHVNWGQARLIR